MNAPKILIVGGSGKVGSAVVQALRQRDAHVRVLSRQPNPVAGGGGVEFVSADLLDPVSVRKALEGVDKVFLLNAVAPDELTQGLIVYGLARKLRLQHLVYLSVFRAEHFKDVPHFASKVAIADALHTFDLPFTLLRPNYFYQNDETFRPLLTGPGLYPPPLGPTGVSAVDVRDIAEAAASALLGGEEHQGKTYNLVGPAALSGPRAAAVWSEVLSREVRYPGENLDGFEEQMRQWSPAWLAYDIRTMFQAYLERGFVAGEGDVGTLTQLLGHAPRRYEDYARETGLAWQK